MLPLRKQGNKKCMKLLMKVSDYEEDKLSGRWNDYDPTWHATSGANNDGSRGKNMPMRAFYK